MLAVDSLKSMLIGFIFLFLTAMSESARRKGRPSGSGRQSGSGSETRFSNPRESSSGNITRCSTGARDSRTLSQGSSFSSGLVQSASANSRNPYRGHHGIQLFNSVEVEEPPVVRQRFDPENETDINIFAPQNGTCKNLHAFYPIRLISLHADTRNPEPVHMHIEHSPALANLDRTRGQALSGTFFPRLISYHFLFLFICLISPSLSLSLSHSISPTSYTVLNQIRLVYIPPRRFSKSSARGYTH